MSRLDKRQKNFFHTDIVLHSANTSEIQATKKPHNYHKIAVWQKDDRIRKSPLKFCVCYYSELEGDCQASIITELWLKREKKNYKMKCERYLNESAFRTFFVLNSKKCTKQEGGET